MIENRTAKDEIRLKQLTTLVGALIDTHGLGMFFDAIAGAIPGVDFVHQEDRDDVLNVIRACRSGCREADFIAANEKRPDVSAEPPHSLN